jgi:hypothetical protein
MSTSHESLASLEEMCVGAELKLGAYIKELKNGIYNM